MLLATRHHTGLGGLHRGIGGGGGGGGGTLGTDLLTHAVHIIRCYVVAVVRSWLLAELDPTRILCTVVGTYIILSAAALTPSLPT